MYTAIVIDRVIPAVITIACVWGVLDKRLKTRTVGTLALSLIALRAVSILCS